MLFLSTFLVGLSAEQGVDTTLLPDAEIGSIRNDLQPIETRRPDPVQDLEPLEIVYERRMPVGLHFSTEERFRITNLGSESIYFESKENEHLMANISNAAGLSEDVPLYVTVRELSPGDSAHAFVWIPIDVKYYMLSIDYTVGTRHVPRSSSF
jgi:hypothetical protein